MKTWMYLIIGLLVIMALGAILKIAIGFLFWAGLAVVIGGIAVSLFKGWASDRRIDEAPNSRHNRRLDREADRALKDLEKRSDKN